MVSHFPDAHTNGSGNTGRNQPLDSENIIQIALPGLRPEVVSVASAIQLGRNTDPVPLPAHASFKNCVGVKLLSDYPDVPPGSLQLIRAGSRHHLKTRNRRKAAAHFLG